MVLRFKKGRMGLFALVGISVFLTGSGQAQRETLAPAPVQVPASIPGKSTLATQPLPAGAAQIAAGSGTERPFPDINTLIKQAEAHRDAAQKAARDYIYREVYTEQDTDSHGAVKKTTSEEREIFWINGVYIDRLLARDGKPITGDELKKQNERIDQRIAEAKQRDAVKAAGETPKKKGSYSLSYEQLQQLGTFSNPRRVQLQGRDTIAIDYTGNPKAKTHNILEEILRDVAGTLWFDEREHALARAEGHFVNDFKIGGGLLADVHKGATFYEEWTPVNGEVWLPASAGGRGSARVALFFNHYGVVETRYSDYRKFRASSTLLPGVAEAPGAPEATEPTQPQP
jgi:hypothetical protein